MTRAARETSWASVPAMIRTAVFTMLVSRGVGRSVRLPRGLPEFPDEPPTIKGQ
jgi:hypothetical protein